MRLIDADALPKHLGIEPTHDLGDFMYWVNFTAINNAPTIDAIPVEWIKEWLRRRPAYEDNAYDMLEDWRKENETR